MTLARFAEVAARLHREESYGSTWSMGACFFTSSEPIFPDGEMSLYANMGVKIQKFLCKLIIQYSLQCISS